MQPRKIVQNKTHFRTIAPKVAPKVVSSCTPSFAPAMADIAASSTKPFVMQPQNYALMKVAGQDGTFSFVALPQVAASVGGSVMKTAGIPLQENLKLPIPRYQSNREKTFLSKKPVVQNKPKVETCTIQKTIETKIKEESKDETATLKCSIQATAKEAVSGSGMFLEAQVVNVHNLASLCADKVVPSTVNIASPIKRNNDIKMPAGSQDSESHLKREGAKVIDATNSATVPSPVVFGSPIHLLSSPPKGKVPIMPYSKIKKSIISNCTQLASFSRSLQSSPTKIEVQTSSCEVQTVPSSVTVSKVSDNSNQSIFKPYVPSCKQNLLSTKKRGKKRKYSSDILRYQTKMRLVGTRLILCKERVKSQTTVTNDKEMLTTKKYRRIMPKPFVDIQGLVSFTGSSPVMQTPKGGSVFSNQVVTGKHRWRQLDVSVAQNDSKVPTLAPKLLYKCPVCNHSFQFKHHLQDHLNSHSNKRPYHCRLCRKAYVHSGSLSTHMRLHHSDSRLKKLMCCEFCAKVFGHIRVYYGHLKEVHRVTISSGFSTKRGQKINLTHGNDHGALDRDQNGKRVEPYHRQKDDVQLGILCGRCHFIAPTFSDMKVHLSRVHGDTCQERTRDAVLENKRDTQEEAANNPTRQWKLLHEKQNVFKNSKCDAEFPGSSTSDSKEVSTLLVEGQELQRSEQCHSSGFCRVVQFCCGNGFNCLLCKQVFSVQSELLEHWEKKHKCEDALMLWAIFSSFTKNQKE
ncbi:zinc finger protein 438 [Gastrophryne carolinensis]